MHELYTESFGFSTFGAVLVLTAMVLKNTVADTTPLMKWGKVAVCLLGWAVVFYATSLNTLGQPRFNNARSITALVSILLIILTSMMMHGVLKLPVPASVTQIAFIMGWLGFGYSLGMRTTHPDRGFEFSKKTMAGFTAAVLAVLSTYTLQWEKSTKVVGGPAMVMLCAAWVSYIFGNSLKHPVVQKL